MARRLDGEAPCAFRIRYVQSISSWRESKSMHPKFDRKSKFRLTLVRGNRLLDLQQILFPTKNNRWHPPLSQRKIPAAALFDPVRPTKKPHIKSRLPSAFVRREPVTVVEERMDSIPSPAFFRSRYEVGWIPDGRFSFVPIELNAVFFSFHCVRSSGTHITSVPEWNENTHI